MSKRLWLTLAVVGVVNLRLFAQVPDQAMQNWHQWRGPLATGVAPTGDPPIGWDAATNIRWKREIPGRGSATPIVWGDRVFVATAIETDRVGQTAPSPGDLLVQQEGRGRFRQPPPQHIFVFALLCLDRNSGEVRWQKTAREAVPHEAGHSTNTQASASPITDGQHVYVSFGSHGIYCFDLEGGLKWEVDLGDMQTRAHFGEGASPALHADTLVINWDHEGQSFIVALDAVTGEERWRKDRDEQTTWVTPLIVEAAGRTQVIVNATNRTRSYDLASGDVIWECGGQVGNPIPSPVAAEGVVYVMSGYRGAAIYAIPLDSTGDVTDADTIVWRSDKGASYVPSPLLYDNRLYFIKSNNGILSILNAKTGEPLVDQQRLAGINNIYASPVGAAGRVYLTGRDGTTMVIRHADTIEVLATNRLDESIDASPAIVGKQLFLRGEKHLYCIEEVVKP